MRFRDQLLLLGAAGIVAMLAMAAIGFWGQMRLAAAAERIAATTEALHNHQTAVAMHAGLRADALDALVASFLADPSSGARIEQALQDHTEGLRSALSRNARLPLEADAIAEIRALYDDIDPSGDAGSGTGPVNEFVLVVNDIFKIATEEDPYSATAVMPVYTNAFHTVESGLKTLGTRFEAMHKAQISEIADVRRQVITAQGIGLAVFAVGLVLASLTIVRRVMDQLGGEPAYAAEVVSRIAAGDFTRDVEVSHGGRSLLGDMKVLRHRLRDFIHAQIELGAAFKQGDTDRRLPSEQMQGSYREMAEAVNMIAEELLAVQSKVLETTAHYAAGDFSIDMERLPGKQASITAAMDQVKRQLSAIKNDILRLSAAASRGDFSARGDANRFEHEFREMVVALNRLMTEADAGLGDVGNLLQALASGDLTQSIDSMYSGAFGVLAANANATVIQLTGIIDRIRIATHAIQNAALDISAGNTELSLRTERQSVSLDETTSSMNQLTAAVQKNADNSRQARELAAGAAQIAVRGGQVVDEVVATMNGISASSRKIGDIIGVIDGIAFQTNILALNAAVEAARAGEQGRGFAVVATEVRSLAQRSADAAREIKTLIGESVGTVQTGASLVDAAGRTMHEIVAAVERVSAIMGDISQASEDQAAGIDQVNQSVARMDEVTRQNAVMVERATAAAAALKQQSDSLAKAVSTFRLTSAEGAEGLGSGDLSMWEL